MSTASPAVLPTTPPVAAPPAFRRILGVNFYVGDLPGLFALTKQGGLIAVPSAPVLVDLAADPAHREAVEGCDFAITDSGFMVWLWRLRRGEKIQRISGLKYIRALLNDRDFRQPGAVFWVMPSLEDADENIHWLKRQGLDVSHADCYIAPMYPKGPLSDPELLARIEAARPRFVVINLGGGVQERLGFYLRQALSGRGQELAAGRNQETEDTPSAFLRGSAATLSPLAHRPSPFAPGTAAPFALRPEPPARGSAAAPFAHRPSPFAAGSTRPTSLPAIICTGAAIAFLSGRQVNIPPWADKLFLGWLFRCLYEPGKFIPRYWRSLRLVPLVLRHADRSVSESSC